MARREADPEARRLIAEVLRLEGEPWPDALDAYRDAVFALALRCEFNPGKAEFYRWGRRVLQPFLSVDGRRAEHRADALADIAANAFTWLLKGRARIDHRRRPNIRSMLRRGMRWRAKDLAMAVERCHWRKRSVVDLPQVPRHGFAADQVPGAGNGLRAGRGCFTGGAAMLLIGRGESIAGAARQTGASRQQIYRFRTALGRVAVSEVETLCTSSMMTRSQA